jgi:hypothetical protein
MKPSIGRAILGGLAGTFVLTLLMYVVAPMMGIPKMDIAAMLGSMLGGWSMGMAVHVINGVILFPLIYSFFVFSNLRGSPVSRGTLWGVALWLVAGLMVMPVMGAGFFGSAHGLIGHVAYGALLGGIAGTTGTRTIKAKSR